jgi:dTDP-glucose 4,6-dehydratase
VDGLYRLLLSDEDYQVNLGNPREMTISEFARTIMELTGSRAGVVHHDLPEDDPKQRRPDITKARRILGWNPVVTLEEGMRLTVEYFRTADELAGETAYPTRT